MTLNVTIELRCQEFVDSGTAELDKDWKEGGMLIEYNFSFQQEKVLDVDDGQRGTAV